MNADPPLTVDHHAAFCRTEKLEEFNHKDWAEICWYFPDTKEQFRIGGSMAVIDLDTKDDNLQKVSSLTALLINNSTRHFLQQIDISFLPYTKAKTLIHVLFTFESWKKTAHKTFNPQYAARNAAFEITLSAASSARQARKKAWEDQGPNTRKWYTQPHPGKPRDEDESKFNQQPPEEVHSEFVLVRPSDCDTL